MANSDDEFMLSPSVDNWSALVSYEPIENAQTLRILYYNESVSPTKLVPDLRAAMLLDAVSVLDEMDYVRDVLKEMPELLAEAKDNEGNYAINIAASMGNQKALELFVKEKKANVETRGFEGRTPLMQAAANGRLSIVKFLVEKAKADVYAKAQSDNQPTAIHLAAHFGYVEIVQYLLGKRPDLLEIRDKNNDTILHRAVQNGQLKVVEYLVKEKRANVNVKGADGLTVVMMAVVNNQFPLVKFLVDEMQASIYEKATSETESTALHLAAYFGYLDIVKFFIEKNEDLIIGCRDKNNDTVLHRAAGNGQLKVVEYLVRDKRANVEIRGQYGTTPLIQAAVSNQLPVVKFLIEKAGADIFAKATLGREPTAFHLAVYFGHADIVSYFLAKKPDLIDLRDKFNDAAIHRAADNVQLKMIELLVKKKRTTVESKGFEGRTALMQAAADGKINAVMFLVDIAGADLTAKSANEFEDTALHLAACFGHSECVNYLLTRNKLMGNAVNKKGRTPLSYAIQQNHEEVVKLLQSRGIAS